MVVGDRLSSTYFEENKRPFHNFGNSIVRKSINILFKNGIKDIMTGYRAFSYEFVKTFPVLSKGFEIETEMSIHAVDKNMYVENVVINYRDRPAGSESKLNTYSDGLRVLRTIARLYRNYKPLSFFGIIDLLSTLPLYIGWIFGPVRYLMVVRTFRLIRVFRVFKLFSFLEEGDLLMRSLMLSSRKIMVFFLFVVIMVISLGTIMYMVEGNVENTQFKDIPTSIYWAVVTMTTVGYGDIAPITPVGRFLSAIVMMLGYTIMAVPTGIVSAQFIYDRQHRPNIKKKCKECGSPLPSNAHFCPFCGKETEG
jgi:voltage-gated potassium channel Kch